MSTRPTNHEARRAHQPSQAPVECRENDDQELNHAKDRECLARSVEECSALQREDDAFALQSGEVRQHLVRGGLVKIGSLPQSGGFNPREDDSPNHGNVTTGLSLGRIAQPRQHVVRGHRRHLPRPPPAALRPRRR
eukprot:5492406-Prymnesium_polylepis.1